MQAALKVEPAGSVEDEIERLRTIFSTALPASEDAPEALLHTPAHETDGTGISQFAVPASAFDWNVTLGNIHLLVRASQESEARLQAAEERARMAEARAAEAEHWLRRLHQAVLDGLPTAKPSA